ncbi:MAG: hypothetical protein ACQEVA_21635 [Myxococcota bacterium]
MKPAKIRDDVDPKSAKYRKELIAVIFIVLSLGIFGGTCLGMKIGNAEQAKAEAQNQTQNAETPTKPAEK